MFTNNGPEPGGSRGGARRGRGRPRGPTAQGNAARAHLYRTALELIATRGYEATTLRSIAERAEVSVGLLYRYFPSKRAVVLALYTELSESCAKRAAHMPAGPWHERFAFSLEASLAVLETQRSTLGALAPVLIGDADEGLFAPATQAARQRVQGVFIEAVRGARDAPEPEAADALGRLLYVVHLAVVLLWLLDKSPAQRATQQALALIRRGLPMLALTLRLAPARRLVQTLDALCLDALFGEAPSPGHDAPAHHRVTR
jgi:AcrR family transcriptional regulator